MARPISRQSTSARKLEIMKKVGWRTFGERLHEARKNAGLTLEEVAKRIHSHKGYISGIENSKVNAPSPKAIKRLCQLFGWQPEEMLVVAWAEKAPIDVLETILCLASQCQAKQVA